MFCVQAIVVLAECWLAMSAAQGPDGIRADGGGVRRDGYAAMAKEALDAHAPALLSRGGLALRARARMAAARAALPLAPFIWEDLVGFCVCEPPGSA